MSDARRLSPTGVALALYFILVPVVVANRWTDASHHRFPTLLRASLVLLAVLWLVFVSRVGRDVVRLRRGQDIDRGASAWVAGVVVAVLALGPIAPAHPHTRPTTTIVAGHHTSPSPLAAGSASPLVLAIAARRRLDEWRENGPDPSADVDHELDLVQRADLTWIGRIRSAVAGRVGGVVNVDPDGPFTPGVEAEPLVACVITDDDTPLVSFAREGADLAIPATWDDVRVRASVVGLHDGGRVGLTSDHYELLTLLATRAVRRSAVVWLGSPDDLDDALRASCVVVHRVDRPASLVDDDVTSLTADVTVELLRADPRVAGLVAPFTATLRRRCVEMAAYLALHRHEPVTGERLRARVLGRADQDASLRTLANTATALRRSLGVDDDGPRLHPVSSAGLYETHGLRSDVDAFHSLVTTARRAADGGAAPLRAALSLVHGEPLAAVLRGYEWFLAEGHLAQVQRDGEWAALTLAEIAREHGDVDLAFWALRQGRLVDPYSDDLVAALARVPRSGQLGRNGPGAA